MAQRMNDYKTIEQPSILMVKDSKTLKWLFMNARDQFAIT